jgi:hypothetical protein
MSTSPPAVSRVQRIALGLSLAALAFHFGMTLLYLTPINPIKMAAERPIAAYMLPWFEQRWELFAPSPANMSRYLLVACRTGESEADPPWHDVTSPLLEAKYAYRVTPADRLHRAVQAATALVLGMNRPVIDKMRSRPDEFKDDLVAVDQNDKTRFGIGERTLARIGSQHCDRLHGPGRTTQVRARIVLRDLPPYSRRTDDERSGKVRVYDLEWQPYQQGVAAL